MSNKIAVIVAYFGRFPNYFPLWLKSCGRNPTIDFIVVSDQCLESSISNVKFISMTLEEMRIKASATIGFSVALSHPYKCCDYRPAYGVIFADILKQYDYWGHCDIDLIFGDLQYFFDLYDLYSYDKFGVLGHLALYRNNDKINNSFRVPFENLDYRKVFTTERNCFFDELSGINRIHKHVNCKLFSKRIFVDIATVYKRYRIIDVYNLDEKPRNYPVQTFSWENGKTYHVYEENGEIHKKEYLYVHFQKRPNYALTFDASKTNAFYITNSGFYIKESEPSKEQISKLNPFYGSVYEFIERKYRLFARRVKRRLKKE